MYRATSLGGLGLFPIGAVTQGVRTITRYTPPPVPPKPTTIFDAVRTAATIGVKTITSTPPPLPSPRPAPVLATAPYAAPPVVMPARPGIMNLTRPVASSVATPPRPATIPESTWATMTNQQRLIAVHAPEIAARNIAPAIVRNLDIQNERAPLDRTVEPKASLPATQPLVKPVVIQSSSSQQPNVVIASPIPNLSPGTAQTVSTPAPATSATVVTPAAETEGSPIVKWIVIGAGLYILWSTFGTKSARRKVGL